VVNRLEEAGKSPVEGGNSMTISESSFRSVLCERRMIWLACLLLTCVYAETYNERLTLLPLDRGQLLTRFEFALKAPAGAQDLFSWGDNADCIAICLFCAFAADPSSRYLCQCDSKVHQFAGPKAWSGRAASQLGFRSMAARQMGSTSVRRRVASW
jgi:hypothetical protein